ncbi:MAG: hypothetical protein HC850_08510 [Rhodomicrobium sp.]|nr:hypothetical protein [Rhodomicrobium sp.]
MNHESETDWKRLGSLASSVLRSVEEKRMKQAEFLAAQQGPLDAALPPSPQASARLQLALPFAACAKPLAPLSAGRH